MCLKEFHFFKWNVKMLGFMKRETSIKSITESWENLYVQIQDNLNSYLKDDLILYGQWDFLHREKVELTEQE